MSQNARPIMALSLWQPWATLIAIGAKAVETRGWMPPKALRFNVPLIIHAAAKWSPLQRQIVREEPFKSVLESAGLNPNRLPLGAALCLVTLDRVHGAKALTPWLSDQEIAFGDYGPNRWAWALKDVRPFAVPVPARGQQGLWRWTGPLPEGVQL